MIMIVDDEVDITDSLTAFFRKKELEVYSAYGYQEANEILSQYGVPSILITDFNMPDGSGLELIELVKSKNSEVKCILLTGNADRSVEEFKKAGVDFVVLKPFTKKDIFQKVEEIFKS